ncbi:GNAT family N-acetyltransferase [bacterium]|nr:GNAT family N-acetyltransferase [bacterium]
MGTTVKLKDGTKAVIRPLKENDLEKSLTFFQKLPPEERLYLRVDVTDREVVEQRIKNIGLRDRRRIVAEVNDTIVADAALELRPHGWERHLADFRLIVSPEYNGKGLGMLMAEELYEMALKEQIEEMVVEIMAPQENAKKIFERLGFKQDTVIKKYVKDINGEKQDLILMRCNIEEIWDKIESYFKEVENRDMHEA